MAGQLQAGYDMGIEICDVDVTRAIGNTVWMRIRTWEKVAWNDMTWDIGKCGMNQ